MFDHGKKRRNPQRIVVNEGGEVHEMVARPLEGRRRAIFDRRPEVVSRALQPWVAATWVTVGGYHSDLPAGDFARPRDLSLLAVWSGQDTSTPSAFATLSRVNSVEGRVVTDTASVKALKMGDYDDAGGWSHSLGAYAAAIDLEASRGVLCNSRRRLEQLRDDDGNLVVSENRYRQVTAECGQIDQDLLASSLMDAIPSIWYAIPGNMDLNTVFSAVSPTAAARAARLVLTYTPGNPEPVPVITNKFTVDHAWMDLEVRRTSGNDDVLAVNLAEALGDDLAAFNAEVISRSLRDHEGYGLIPSYLTPPDVAAKGEPFFELASIREMVVYNFCQYLTSGLGRNRPLGDPARSRIWVWDAGNTVSPESLRLSTKEVEFDLWAEPVTRPKHPDVVPFKAMIVKGSYNPQPTTQE